MVRSSLDVMIDVTSVWNDWITYLRSEIYADFRASSEFRVQSSELLFVVLWMLSTLISFSFLSSIFSLNFLWPVSAVQWRAFPHYRHVLLLIHIYYSTIYTCSSLNNLNTISHNVIIFLSKIDLTIKALYKLLKTKLSTSFCLQPKLSLVYPTNWTMCQAW